MPLVIRLTILFFFVSITAIAQVNTNLSFSSSTDSRHKKYFIDSVGVYFSAVTCGETSTVGFGRYTLSANKISFRPLSFDSLSPIRYIRESPATNDTTIKVTFLARYNKIIPDKQFAVDAIDSSGRFFKRFFLNNEGAVFINPVRFRSLRLNYLDHFYTKRVFVPTKRADMTIELSLPPDFFHHHHPQIDLQTGYALILKPGGLFNTAGKRIAAIDEK